MAAWTTYRARTYRPRALPGTLPSIAPFEKPIEGRDFPETKLLPPNFAPVNQAAFSTFEGAHAAIRTWDMKRAEFLFYKALREIGQSRQRPRVGSNRTDRSVQADVSAESTF